MRVLQALVLGGLAIAMTVGPAAAQSGTGAVSGRLVFCKQLPRPLGQAANPDIGASASMDGTVDASVDVDASADGQQAVPDLADVTPGLRRFPTPGFTVLPAANIEVKVVGLPLTATTDASGQFVLQGVPAAQPVTIAAAFASAPTVSLQLQNVVVSAGQTLDLGTVGLSGCAATILTPQAADQAVTVVVEVTNPSAPGAAPGADQGAGQGAGTDVPTPGNTLPRSPVQPVEGSAQ